MFSELLSLLDRMTQEKLTHQTLGEIRLIKTGKKDSP